jgi:polysaccharide export outer membrane protein
VLALAGGITATGDNTVVVMTDRTGTTERIEVDIPGMYRAGDLSGDIELASGDTVFVPDAPVFYVYGAVQRAGAYRLESDTLVQHALSLGGGLTPRGSERGIEIHRRMPDGSLQELDADIDDAVVANDVIYVRESIF